MGNTKPPRNRGVNVGVRFDLAQFTERLFSALGSNVQFIGPGPCRSIWHSCTTSTSERFAIDYLAEELFSKYDDGKPSPEKRRKAVARFMEGETSCALTNCKFSPLASGQPPAWLEDESLLAEHYSLEDSAVFRRARQVISKILGAFPGWDSVLQYADFGPGATTRLPRRLGHRSNKWAGHPQVTPFAASPLQCLFEAYPLMHQRFRGPGYEVVAGNKLDWVPKNYKTDRTIAIEPDWNMFLQKGLGGLLRRRLKRVGQDLDDQSTNRFLAALGSITGDLATLDLSMASDTVSYRLVEYLIRPDWFEALEQCRSSIGFYTDENGVECAVPFEKFSSMGNGYTFELETVIFYGILRAVSELSGEPDHRLYVYGDDIVIPSGMADLAMTYLSKAGFIVNPEKSFWTSPFRESCGGHYFAGDDVTPFYVREPVDTLDRLFLLHNNVYRWFNRHVGICDPARVVELLNWIRGHAPQQWYRPRLLSEDVGDGAFIGSFDDVCPKPAGKRRKTYGWEGWSVQTLQYKARSGPHQQIKEFPRGAGPDLASLWAKEFRAYKPILFPGQDASLWFGQISSRDDIDGSFPMTKGGDVPHTERWWYVGSQVLPWLPGTSWW